MNVFYLTSIIALIIVLLLIKKTDKKENFLFWLFLSIIIILCYNIFECYILSLIKIECSLIVLTVVNVVITLLFILMLKKKRQNAKILCEVARHSSNNIDFYICNISVI